VIFRNYEMSTDDSGWQVGPRTMSRSLGLSNKKAKSAFYLWVKTISSLGWSSCLGQTYHSLARFGRKHDPWAPVLEMPSRLNWKWKVNTTFWRKKKHRFWGCSLESGLKPLANTSSSDDVNCYVLSASDYLQFTYDDTGSSTFSILTLVCPF